ncbi:tripartite tricarboxylate transporter substrate binding protein [Rhodobacterales bacterium FZCC0188]|nr:tripartite tricarboxylate transporter substrate binding protein [Rhodobacterales bacterium FZCC0188]
MKNFGTKYISRWAGAVAIATVTLGLGQPVLAEYPERDIRVIVPWGAGGGADAIVRKIMSIAEQELPHAVFVENHEGGVTAIGINKVMGAGSDGYTVGALTYDSIVTVPWQNLLPGYDLDRLEMIAQVTSEPNAIMVGKQTGYNSLDDLLAAAKANPGEISMGIHGLGSMTHLTLLQFEEKMGVDFRLVSYPNGSAGQKEAILSGEVEAAITSLGDFAPVLQSGDALGLVEFSSDNNPAFPEVPTSGQVGLDLQTGSFLLFAVPEGTPSEAVDVLEEAIQTAWNSDEFQTWAAQVGVTATWRDSADITNWTAEFQSSIFTLLDDLVAKGVIEK